MGWPEDAAGELPGPHAGEPDSLRREILDELNDHLQSSLEHEQLSNSDAAGATQRVLERFGDPSIIARRLWWDAMWGKVMLNRVTIAFVVLLCLCSIFATGLIWQAMQQNQQMTAALVAEIRSMRTEADAPADDQRKYLDWVPVSVKLVYEDGEPVTEEGFQVGLSGQGIYGGDSNAISIEESEQAGGIFDLGIVKPSALSLAVKTPWSDWMHRDFVARPGSPAEVTIVCPRSQFDWQELDLTVAWPDDLKQLGLWVYLWLETTDRMIDEDDWRRLDRESRYVLIDGQGQYRQAELYIDPEMKTRWVSHFPAICDPQSLARAMTGKAEFISPPAAGRPSYNQSDEEGYAKLMLSQPVFADLSPPRSSLALERSGMQVGGMMVLIPKESEPTDSNVSSFVTILPSTRNDDQSRRFTAYYMSLEYDQALNSATIKPTETIIELVRQRLKQLEAETTSPSEGSKVGGI